MGDTTDTTDIVMAMDDLPGYDIEDLITDAQVAACQFVFDNFTELTTFSEQVRKWLDADPDGGVLINAVDEQKRRLAYQRGFEERVAPGVILISLYRRLYNDVCTVLFHAALESDAKELAKALFLDTNRGVGALYTVGILSMKRKNANGACSWARHKSVCG